MGNRWRKSLKLSTGIIISALLSSQGFTHPSVPLVDVYGNLEKDVLDNQALYSGYFDTNSTNATIQVFNGTDNVTLYKGTPISFEKSCVSSECHSTILQDARESHHVAIGLHDMGWMDSETKGDDTGAKDFVANNVLKMRYFRSKSHYGGW